MSLAPCTAQVAKKIGDLIKAQTCVCILFAQPFSTNFGLTWFRFLGVRMLLGHVLPVLCHPGEGLAAQLARVPLHLLQEQHFLKSAVDFKVRFLQPSGLDSYG